MVLQWRVDAVGAVAEWTEFAVGEPVDPDLFTWSGPVRTPDEEHERNAATQDATRDAHRRWFTEHVAPGALSVDVTLDVTVQYLRAHDSRTGAFDADLGGGVAVLARRPQSTEPWDRQWQGDQHTWTANGFDWAVMIGSRTLAPDQLAALQRQLGAIPD